MFHMILLSLFAFAKVSLRLALLAKLFILDVWRRMRKGCIFERFERLWILEILGVFRLDGVHLA
jgi:hypothetical protein